MPKPRRVRICGIEASGATVREARRLAVEKVTRYVEESADGPIIRMLPAGIILVVWRAVESWGYLLVDPADAPGENGPCRHSGHATVREAEHRARRHAAQWTRDRLPEHGLECLSQDDEEGRRLHRRWLSWQDSYAAAKSAGSDDAQARAEANRLVG